jgi:hypothetical protein
MAVVRHLLGNKTSASAHGMGSGVLTVDVMAIGCLGVDHCGERFFVLIHFKLNLIKWVLESQTGVSYQQRW